MNIHKVLIIEDEVAAAEKLTAHIHRYDPRIKVAATLTHLEEAVPWLSHHQASVDLIFMDIQLGDGQSFDLFEQVDIHRPVIFTTAYHEYALEAFKANGIDYLLKPISFTDFRESMEKLFQMEALFSPPPTAMAALLAAMQPSYKERFLVKVGEHLRPIRSEEVCCMYAEGKYAFLWTRAGKKYNLEYTLESLYPQLDPAHFFRVNRSFIVHQAAIDDIQVYAQNRLKLHLSPPPEKEVIISRDKVRAFKAWLGGN